MDTNTNFINSNTKTGIPPAIAYRQEIIIQTTNHAVMQYASTLASYHLIGSIMKQESVLDSLANRRSFANEK